MNTILVSSMEEGGSEEGKEEGKVEGREAKREGVRKGRRRRYCTHSSRKFCCGPMIEPGRQILQWENI